MLRIQVNLVLRAVQSEADSALCVTAIDIVNEEGLYLLGHAFLRFLVSIGASVGERRLADS